MKDRAPKVFAAFREIWGITEEAYERKLCKAPLIEMSSAGKSGGFFFMSNCKQFIIKTVPNTDADSLSRILKNYYNYQREVKDTFLPRFFGLHRLELNNGSRFYFVIMQNIFYTHLEIHDKFDLKGSTHNRALKPEEKKPGVR